MCAYTMYTDWNVLDKKNCNYYIQLLVPLAVGIY